VFNSVIDRKTELLKFTAHFYRESRATARSICNFAHRRCDRSVVSVSPASAAGPRAAQLDHNM